MTENSDIKIGTALKGIVFAGGIVSGYFMLYIPINSRITALETTVVNAKLADIPMRQAEILTRLDGIDKKLDSIDSHSKGGDK